MMREWGGGRYRPPLRTDFVKRFLTSISLSRKCLYTRKTTENRTCCLRHCYAVSAEHTTQHSYETAIWKNVKKEYNFWYLTLPYSVESNLEQKEGLLENKTPRMAWARLALVPAAVAINLTFLYAVVRNAPGEVYQLRNTSALLFSGWSSVFPLKPRGYSQSCRGPGSLSSAASSICPSALLLSLSFQTGSVVS